MFLEMKKCGHYELILSRMVPFTMGDKFIWKFTQINEKYSLFEMAFLDEIRLCVCDLFLIFLKKVIVSQI